MYISKLRHQVRMMGYQTVTLLKVAEGIMFHSWPYSWNGVPAPRKRYPWQHYISFTFEPAAHNAFRYV